LTTIQTDMGRTVAVHSRSNYDVLLEVKDDYLGKSIMSSITHAEAEKLGLALLGKDAEVITDLPEAEVEEHGPGIRNSVRSGGSAYFYDTDPERVLTHAKDLLAIHKKIVELNAKEEEAKAAEAAKKASRAARRDELAEQFNPGIEGGFRRLGTSGRAAINYIIDLEEAAK